MSEYFSSTINKNKPFKQNKDSDKDLTLSLSNKNNSTGKMHSMNTTLSSKLRDQRDNFNFNMLSSKQNIPSIQNSQNFPIPNSFNSNNFSSSVNNYNSLPSSYRGASKQPKQSHFTSTNKLESHDNLIVTKKSSSNYFGSEIKPGNLSSNTLNDIHNVNNISSRLPMTTKNKPIKLMDNKNDSEGKNNGVNTQRDKVKSPKRSFNNLLNNENERKKEDRPIESRSKEDNRITKENFSAKQDIGKKSFLDKEEKNETNINSNGRSEKKILHKSIYNSNKNMSERGFRGLNSFQPSKEAVENKPRSSSVKAPEKIDLMSLIHSNHPPLTLNILNNSYLFYENSKTSAKNCHSVSAYAANTHQGCVRNYNEDRVSIILNIIKPQSFKGAYWPKCSFFAVYDGHGGAGCADFLRDNLHQLIIKDSNFPHSPKDAIFNGCLKAEEEFTSNIALNSSGSEVVNRSGSCAVFALIVDDVCYVGNVGDSRAVLSKYGGKEANAVTKDHKPNIDSESKRIYSNGGRVYQTTSPAINLSFFSPLLNSFSNANSNSVLTGPSRVFPGRLSVSRSFGDIEAKIPRFGGLPNVLISTPEVFSFKVTEETDFLFLACDGVFDLLKNEEIVQGIYMCMPHTFPSITKGSNYYSNKETNIHSLCGKSVDMIMKTCLSRNSLDNITCVLISFSGFENKLKSIQSQVNSSSQNQSWAKYKDLSSSNLPETGLSKTARTSDFYTPSSSSTGLNENSLNTKLASSTTDKKWKFKENNNVVPLINDNKFKQTNIDKAYKSIYSSSIQDNKTSTSVNFSSHLSKKFN